MGEFSAWIGRQDVREDRLDPARSNALLAALGETASLTAGDALPVLHHWLHFWEVRTPDETGPDGHARRGGFLPPAALPRRMWAGGRLLFHRPLRLGEEVRRQSTILSIEEKEGRSGALIFVTVRHEIGDRDGPAIDEEQDLVYRAASTADAPATAADASPGEAWVDPDPVLLFRYSALTMNSHRIHYDVPYVTGEEGYPGLVVHGPLQATLLARHAEHRLGGRLTRFRFRGAAPAFADRRLHIHAAARDDGLDLWTSQGGQKVMTAVAATKR
jgi:3-methylfumaryl-CoA hydratase